MFNNTALYKGPWVALMDNSHPTGKGWELYSIETDPGQNNNVAAQNPDLVKEVGVVVPHRRKDSSTIFKDLSSSKPDPERQYRRDYTTI